MNFFSRKSHIIYFLKNIRPSTIHLILKQSMFLCLYVKPRSCILLHQLTVSFHCTTLSEYISGFGQVRSDLKLGMTEEEFVCFVYFKIIVTIILKQNMRRAFDFFAHFCAVV